MKMGFRLLIKMRSVNKVKTKRSLTVFFHHANLLCLLKTHIRCLFSRKYYRVIYFFTDLENNLWNSFAKKVFYQLHLLTWTKLSKTFSLSSLSFADMPSRSCCLVNARRPPSGAEADLYLCC